MTVALVLLGYGLAVTAAGPAVVRRSRWVERAPRLGIAAWQSLSLAAVASVVLGGLALSVPGVRLDGTVSGFLDACLAALRARYATPGGAAVGVAGLGLALLVGARSTWAIGRTLARAGNARRRHREALRLLGREDRETGAVVVEHALPAVYCLPGVRGRIVLTSGALAALTPGQLRAVLAHERAHLRGRHDLVAAAAVGLAAAFPRVALFRVARDEIVRLLELAADDAATRATHRLVAAEALLNVADRQVPAGALAAGGPGTGHRVRRLIAGASPLGRARGLLAGALAAVPVAVPLALAAAPAVALAGSACCTAPASVAHAPTEVCARMEDPHDCLTMSL
ncbi:M56 family metallopeptidase [Nocardiopsis sp. RSe5-2]|uniref:M56 family metallopeptidase n=1 Tax=Nocardiopsis endophytica TaxID=3018445 RepID=A0ABT4UE18_9ACTN|nr:M56 family metallopeptidase [Nocardiopsis endophytica]MDA2815229.1 M56 family metallopeptidase [Nocardiopsis endophytica]